MEKFEIHSLAPKREFVSYPGNGGKPHRARDTDAAATRASGSDPTQPMLPPCRGHNGMGEIQQRRRRELKPWLLNGLARVAAGSSGEIGVHRWTPCEPPLSRRSATKPVVGAGSSLTDTSIRAGRSA